jgi:hypothetical protein
LLLSKPGTVIALVLRGEAEPGPEQKRSSSRPRATRTGPPGAGFRKVEPDPGISEAEQSLVRGQDAGLDKWPDNPGPDVAEVKAWLERITNFKGPD